MSNVFIKPMTHVGKIFFEQANIWCSHCLIPLDPLRSMVEPYEIEWSSMSQNALKSSTLPFKSYTDIAVS